MRRNRHLGLRHIKWFFISLAISLTYLYFSKFILEWIMPYVSEFFKRTGDEYGHHIILIYPLPSNIELGFFLSCLLLLMVGHLPDAYKFVKNLLFDWEGWIAVKVFLIGGYSLVVIALIYHLGYVVILKWWIFPLQEQELRKFEGESFTLALAALFFSYYIIRFGIAYLIFNHLRFTYKTILSFKDSTPLKRLFVYGFGGSSKWENFLRYSKMRADVRFEQKRGSRLGHVLLGRTLFDDDPFPRPVVLKDDAHLLTVGMTGSGKSTTVLFPNLALYEGNVFAFDPKGELAKNSFKRRSNTNHNPDIKPYAELGGTSFALDPFGELKDQYGEHTFNPLTFIDLESNRSGSYLSAISDGCVVPSKEEKDQHWTEWAKNIIEAMIVHVLTKYPEDNQNLPFILDLITGNQKIISVIPEDSQLDNFTELLLEMRKNVEYGGIASQVANQLLEMGDNEKGSVLSTVYRSLKWVGNPAMRKQLKGTNILQGADPYSVYIVLPAGLISPQMRWVRVLMGMFITRQINIFQSIGRALPTLFIVDEFGQLGGNIEAIEKGFPILRGYNSKLWLFVQSLSQLKAAFGERFNDVTGASTMQFFGINDPDTAEWMSKRMGGRLGKIRERKKWYGRSKVVRERLEPLLYPDEIEYFLGKNSSMQIVLPTDGYPMRLERLSYKKLRGFNPLPYDLKGHFR